MLERLCNNEQEQVLINSIVNDESLLYEFGDTVAEKHFFNESHQAIWKTMKKVEQRSGNVTPMTLASELQKENDEHLYAFKSLLATEQVADVKMLVLDLVEWYNKRELYKLSLEIQSSLEQKNGSSFIVKNIETKTDHMDIALGTTAKSYREHEKIIENLPPLPIYPSGISFIDEALGGGFEAGQLWLVMGDPEAGKTIMTTQILQNASNKFKTLFFCFEFTVRQFLKTNLKRKKDFNKDNLMIVNEGYALSDVEREVKIWAKKGAKFIVIDSQMRVDNSENKGTVEQMESEKFSKLAKLCHRLEVTILFITQQGKDDSKGGVHTPMGSKKGAHEANGIIYIHKLKPDHDKTTGDDLNKEKRLFEISKNKQNGKHFKTEVTLNPVVLEFYRKYNKEPKIVKYVEGKGGKQIPVVITEVDEDRDTIVDIPDIF